MVRGYGVRALGHAEMVYVGTNRLIVMIRESFSGMTPLHSGLRCQACQQQPVARASWHERLTGAAGQRVARARISVGSGDEHPCISLARLSRRPRTDVIAASSVKWVMDGEDKDV